MISPKPDFWVSDDFDWVMDYIARSHFQNTEQETTNLLAETTGTYNPQSGVGYDLLNNFNVASTSTVGHYQAPEQQSYHGFNPQPVAPSIELHCTPVEHGTTTPLTPSQASTLTAGHYRAPQQQPSYGFYPQPAVPSVELQRTPIERGHPYATDIDAAIPRAYPLLLDVSSTGTSTYPIGSALSSHRSPSVPDSAYGLPSNGSAHRIARGIQPLVTSMPGPSQAIQSSRYAHTHAGCAPPAFAQTQNVSAHRSQPISRYVRDGKNRVSLPPPPPPIISYQLDMEDGSRKGKGVARMDLASQSEQRADSQAPRMNFNKSQECEHEEGALANAPSSPSNALKSQYGAEALPPVKRRKTGSGIKPKRKSPKPPKAWCMECGTGFGRSYDLQRHLQSAKAHSTSPAYKCRYCGAQVTREDSLLVHERMHVREDGGCGARRAAGDMEAMIVEG
ncbi:hypothetical protein EW146_g7893 [Bondarzewia mesenterica]|uniref:C2H2-type domain-containing protein n=1 Tax=Bondarzewia mesenterica TaxID=1095465 RepID=A0A4S4LJ96_9AGAM|nr:hypothetical protein EW146_g7893 [Bondarzewia mesenterica]